MDEPRLEQLESLWVDGSPIAFTAAALGRADEMPFEIAEGQRPWWLMVANASPPIPAGEMTIQATVRDGVTYGGRARWSFDKRTAKIFTTVLTGTAPLAQDDAPRSRLGVVD